MNTLKKMVDQFLAWAVILISSVLVLCVLWQVFSRYCLGTPSVATDEIARFMFMWVGLVGAAYAVSLKRHLAIDLLTQKLTGTRKLVSEVVIILMTLLFAGLVMVYGGLGLVQKTLSTQQLSPALGIPMGYIYFAIPFSGIAIIFYSLVDLLNKFTPHSSVNTAG
ncbi:TRAP transporter small permease [Budviciaceae bacterium CWB-B4]|uniref:TRAP transporter small permease protein n=2 Tax=Limnobaculum TaxID=2172100 RepID=A0A9D7AIK5_9GAMM|nr:MULTISPECIES: TRAP transporter small permease [Limnobaculum]MBK5073561.1 TRAP transporter small permease [Limnobaculum xujianqingii]MBK5176708.1 TRAP transporter small permease [Limnobaculum xujianqingii]QBH95342.1 TRAP transporter small permease [Limnobaculum zhutongyuii]TQS89040.1 TRAP transporter small permease [Limnobaculum zhutongyuii]